MQMKFKATGSGPDYYEIDGEAITAHKGDESETYDLSVFPEGGKFEGVDKLAGTAPIRNIARENGELRVTLCQRVIAGQYPGKKAHWRDSEWIDAADYTPETCFVVPTGMAGVDDYVAVQAVGRASGEYGWTVRKGKSNG